MPRKLLIGAHMSIAGGVHHAFELGVRAGCRTIQIFLKNSTQWKGKPLTLDERERFREMYAESRISPVLAHASYLINLASPNDPLFERSTAALAEEMERANFLGVPFLILHPGSHKGSGEMAGIGRICSALDRVLQQVPPPVSVLLENTAGQGASIGHTFEQLALLYEGVKTRERIGFCLDTCHLHAAGYDIRTRPAFLRTLREFDRLIGLDRVCAWHVNDSKAELGRRLDRHAHIGQGTMGLEAFRTLVNYSRMVHVPKILETPKGPDLHEDRMNLALLRSLYRG
jgi:deoxyribonuclease-4